jgi:hypothetical protein
VPKKAYTSNKKKTITVSKVSYIGVQTQFFNQQDMQVDSQSKSNEFYTNCMRYFEALRKTGKQDYGFEDEFFYTMPAMSEKIVSEQ